MKFFTQEELILEIFNEPEKDEFGREMNPRKDIYRILNDGDGY